MTVASTSGTTPQTSTLWTVIRLISGWLILAVLAYFMWAPGDWPIRLFVWILFTLLADELAGWFGYIAIALGALAFFSPAAPPEQWFIIVPLIGGALFATLLVKHSGGLLVLPFAGAIFALPVFLANQLRTMLDPTVTLFSNAQFQRTALMAMIIGLVISLIRQIIGLILGYRARKGLSSPFGSSDSKHGVRRGPKPVRPKVQLPTSNEPIEVDLAQDTDVKPLPQRNDAPSTTSPTIRTAVVPPTDLPEPPAPSPAPPSPPVSQDFVVDIQLPSDDQPTPPHPPKERT